MKKDTIAGIVALMAITLFGLVVLQFYWVKNDIRFKEQEFSKNVNEAMHETVRENQRMITTDFMKSMIRVIDLSGRQALVIHHDTIKLPLSEGTNNNLDLIIKGQDIDFFRNFNQWKPGKQFDLNDPFQAYQYFSQDDGQWEFMGKILQSIAGEIADMTLSMDNQINLTSIDQIFNKNLQRHGIDLAYEIAVVSPEKARMFCTSKFPDKSKILGSKYRMNLYPSRFIASPTFLQVYFPKKIGYLMSSLWLRVITAFVFIAIIIFSFGFTIWTILRQKKISLMKNDFINNMTHEFKTPITTISLVGQAIGDPDIVKEESRLNRFGKIILDESKKLGSQVEKILQMAILDKTDPKLKSESVDMNEVVEQLIENYQLRFPDNPEVFSIDLAADNAMVKGDSIHLSNVIDNLIDNALKYSIVKPRIKISTFNTGNKIAVKIEDNGIGMNKDDLKKIFERFYRVHTGNVHDVKGFGLGLAYVKSMLNAHNGEIKVQSEKGKGSSFEVLLPFIK